MNRRAIGIGALVALAASMVACGGSSGPATARVDLKGAGASFPFPLYDRWFKEYSAAHDDVRIDYQSMGSGAGITQFTNHTVDFGASDAAMTDDEISKVDKGVQLIPMTAGAVVLSYNLPALTAPLRLSRAAYAGIFLGTVKNWNDPLIAKANPGVTLPDLPISVVHRADSSGTTFVFTQHLSAISPAWKAGPGTSKNPDWPTGIGAKDNAGVTSTIHQTPGAIGYVEYGYAKNTGLPLAWLENKSGAFVEPTTPSAQAALNATSWPDNLRLFLPDPDGKDAYPIVTYTWLLAYRTYDDPAKAAALKSAIRWCLNDGQHESEALGYVPLPDAVVAMDLKALDNIH